MSINTKSDTYKSLAAVAEKIGARDYAKDVRAGNTRKRGYRFVPSPEHVEVVKAMPAVLTDQMSLADAMLLVEAFAT